MLTRRSILAGGIAATLRGASQRRHNVVVFLTDDHGAWATAFGGCAEMRTPNLDRLAREGVRFTNAFAATPVCSPSRMTYLTGKLPSAHGVQEHLRPVDSFGPKSRAWLRGQVTYSELLARAGYRTGMCGKWHMGQDEKAQAGFAWWSTVPGGGGTYRDPEFVKNGVRVKRKGFKEDLIGDDAIEFLDQAKDGPFFLLVPFYAPHDPYDELPERYAGAYSNSPFSCFPNDPPHPNQNPILKQNHGNRHSKLGYSTLVSAADATMGRILKRLEELRLTDNTLVIFTADQGYNTGHHGVWGKGNGTFPYNMYEESIRVPMVWKHPGRLRAGTVVDAMVSNYDFFPTLLEYLSIPAPPADRSRAGASYAGFLRGRPPARWRDRLYFEYAYTRAVRTKDLKYAERSAEWTSELFDLSADPGETKNLIDDPAYARQRAALAMDLKRFFERTGAPPLNQWRSTTQQDLTLPPGSLIRKESK